MSETQEATTAPEAPVATPAQETDWKAEARKWEARAKENVGAASRLAEIEEASKTAEQKAAERLQTAETRASELERKVDRAEVAALKGVPIDLISGASREEMESSADKLIEFRGAQSGTPKPDPSQGPKGTTQKKSTGAMFEDFFNDNLSL